MVLLDSGDDLDFEIRADAQQGRSLGGVEDARRWKTKVAVACASDGRVRYHLEDLHWLLISKIQQRQKASIAYP
jgi:hypothetical protein